LTGGTGTGATVSVQYADNIGILMPLGGGCIQPSGGNGTQATNVAGITSVFCEAPGGISMGASNNTLPTASGAETVIIGSQNLTIGTGNLIVGTGNYDYGQHNILSFSSHNAGTKGSDQTWWVDLNGTATGNATSVVLTSDSTGTISQQNSIGVTPVTTTRGLTWTCQGTDTVTGNWERWNGTGGSRTGTLYRLSTGDVVYTGDASTALAADTYSSSSAVTGSTLTLSANTTSEGLQVVAKTPTTNSDLWNYSCFMRVDQTHA
jgi:hypothetical protein